MEKKIPPHWLHKKFRDKAMLSTATVNYHVISTETQAFQFDVDGIIGNLISPELVQKKVKVQNIRDDLSTIDFENDGIVFENHSSQVKDFEAPLGWQETYNDELRALLKQKIGAKDVTIFDHTVRIDDPNSDRKPARNVHNDYSRQGAEQRLIDLLGKELASTYRAGHYGFVNIWRPVKHIIKSAPLGFIHPSSMSSQDWMTIELIYPDRTGQILGVAVNDDHKWFYLSQMTPDEVAIFNIYDNKGRPHLAHSALDMDDNVDPLWPRKSIESRTLVRYN